MLLQGAGTKDKVLIEIFASRSNQQIKALSDVYFKGKSYIWYFFLAIILKLICF